jgi:acyl carrier protein
MVKLSPRLTAVILKELKLDNFDLYDETLANQVPGWDSLSHINILTAIEKEFKINFKVIEIMRLKKLGDLQSLVDSKMNQ